MTTQQYLCTDGIGDPDYITAESKFSAAQQYVDAGEWGDITSTAWFSVHVKLAGDPEDEGEWIDIDKDPAEPQCADGHDQGHQWRTPYSVLGGLKENPGVSGHGGGVVMVECCRRCGRYQVIDTWAQDPETGEQGLTSTSYREADESSMTWLNRLETLAS